LVLVAAALLCGADWHTAAGWQPAMRRLTTGASALAFY